MGQCAGQHGASRAGVLALRRVAGGTGRDGAAARQAPVCGSSEELLLGSVGLQSACRTGRSEPGGRGLLAGEGQELGARARRRTRGRGQAQSGASHLGAQIFSRRRWRALQAW